MKIGISVAKFIEICILAICAITVGAPLSQQVSCSSKIYFASSLLHYRYTATNSVLLAALVFEILSIATGKLMNNDLVPAPLKVTNPSSLPPV